MKIYKTRCFGMTNHSGNESIVIQDSNLGIKERLLFAKNQNKPACVFIEHTNDEAVIKLDYYYPHKRSLLCLHGTLAAAYIYFTEHSNSHLTCITSMANQKIAVEKMGDDIFITVQQQTVDCGQANLDAEKVSALLNIDLLAANPIEYYIASSGSPKLFVEVADLQLLYSLQPNLNLINEWSTLNRISGIYAYCKLYENKYSGRNFNHINPALEDSATGVAATALTYHLKRDLIIYQGAITRNECIMYTKFLGDKVQISGKVTCEKV